MNFTYFSMTSFYNLLCLQILTPIKMRLQQAFGFLQHSTLKSRNYFSKLTNLPKVKVKLQKFNIPCRQCCCQRWLIVFPTGNIALVYRQNFILRKTAWHITVIYTVIVNKDIPQVQKSQSIITVFCDHTLSRKHVLSYPNNVVHSVDIAVTHVHSDCSDGKAILFS